MIVPNVKLVEVNENNWYACCTLEVRADQQKSLESNAVSIAQSKFERALKPYAIYADEKLADFLMFYFVQEEVDGYWVYRIMVDRNYQRQGIAKEATQLMI